MGMRNLLQAESIDISKEMNILLSALRSILRPMIFMLCIVRFMAITLYTLGR